MVQKYVRIVPFLSSLGSEGKQPLWYLQHDWKEGPEIFHQSLFLWGFPVAVHSQDARVLWVSIWVLRG